MKKNSARWSVAGLFGVFLVAWCAQSNADDKVVGHLRALEIQDLLGAKNLHTQGVTAAFSPDGKWVASTVCDPAKSLPVERGEINRSSKDAARNSLGCDIWLYSVTSAEQRNVTRGGGSNWSPSWSPDGELLAFHSDRDGRPKLWLWDRTSGTVRKLSDEVTRQRFGFEAPLWLPDGKRLLVKLLPQSGGESKTAGSAEEDPPSVGTDRVTVTVFVSPTVSSKAASAEPAAKEFSTDLGLITVRTGELQRVASNVDSVAQALSPDGRHLAYFEQSSIAGDVYSPYSLVVLELATGVQRKLALSVQPGFPGALSWSPDSKKIAYVSVGQEPAREGDQSSSTSLRSYGGRLYIAPIYEQEGSCVTDASGNRFLTSAQPPLWSADGSLLYLMGHDHHIWKVDSADCRAAHLAGDSRRKYLRLVGGVAGNTIAATSGGPFLYAITEHVDNYRHGISRINLSTDAAAQQLEEDRFYGSEFEPSVMSPDGTQVIFQSESGNEPANLWISDTTFRKPRRLSDLNPELGERKLGESRLIEFESGDGDRLQGAVLLPSGYRPGTRYPTVVWVYASDAEAARNVNRFGLFDSRSFNMQMLASRGYAVLWPSIPTRVGSPIDDLMKSVMPAIGKAVELGITDSARLAVMGNSNGGYSTLALITRTRRFKAAVMNAGFGDLTAFHGTMGGVFVPWVEKMGGSMGVPPWEAPFRYVENSPIFALDRIQTPLIIQAGTEDKAIIQHSDQVWVEMQRLQRPAIYLRYAGEDHALRGRRNLQDYWQRVLAFFGEHLSVEGVPSAVSDSR